MDILYVYIQVYSRASHFVSFNTCNTLQSCDISTLILVMNTGRSTLLGWCLLALAGGGALYVTRREYLASKQKQKEEAYISDKNATWQDILTYEEKRIKYEEEKKQGNQPPSSGSTS